MNTINEKKDGKMSDNKKYPFSSENPLEYKRTDEFMRIFEAVLASSNYGPVLDTYSRITMHCSRCASECMLYSASKDPRDIPCYRSSLLLNIYRRNFTLWGRIKSSIFGGTKVTDMEIDQILESYYHCTMCGRCTRYCPFGIDHRLVVRLGRYILSKMGIVPKNLQVSVREQLQGETRNTSAIPLKALRDNLEFLEEEIEEIKGVKVTFPIDVQDAEYVFFAPVSDYLVEAETLMGIACVMHEAGASWTLASGNYDAINYGLFYDDGHLEEIAMNMVEEVRKLNGKKILIGECGHAYMSAWKFIPAFSEKNEFPVVHILELTQKFIEEKKIHLDDSVIKERVTYHDPCNIARNGRIVEQPRAIIRSFIKDFVEMTPHGNDNYCCGGGGGTVVVNELKPYRMTIAGKKKVEQMIKTNADIVITPCANCKKQFGELILHHKLPMQHAGLHDLIFKAIEMKRGGSNE
ncbi:MAG TPA: (Fe-S)-binding protein [Spirochaetota bacterium]|nr:(Fe-S)-binding protein [Spirochaetota bacterium]